MRGSARRVEGEGAGGVVNVEKPGSSGDRGFFVMSAMVYSCLTAPGVEFATKSIVAEGKTWFKAFDGLKSKDVAMRSPQTKGKVAYKKGDSRAWGWSTATVRSR